MKVEYRFGEPSLVDFLYTIFETVQADCIGSKTDGRPKRHVLIIYGIVLRVCPLEPVQPEWREATGPVRIWDIGERR